MIDLFYDYPGPLVPTLCTRELVTLVSEKVQRKLEDMEQRSKKEISQLAESRQALQKASEAIQEGELKTANS